MKDIGEVLKKTRVEKDLSLEDVAESTKIHTRYLQAIEDGEWEIMPGEVYLRGFLRSYARFLGIDGNALIKKYDKKKNEEVIDELSEADEDTASSRNFLVFLAFLLFILMGFAVYYFFLT